MANERLVALLKHTSIWHNWRKSNPDIELDLNNADLRHTNLSNANLNGANLSSADLSHANLSRADLSHADLSHADLSHADLSHADLSHADLSSANLREAQITSETIIDDKWRLVWELVTQEAVNRDLHGANLSSANLSGANFSGANLSGANFSGANFSGADLSGADLSHTDLSGADLSHTDLSHALLSWADLRQAHITLDTDIDDKWRLVWELVTQGAIDKKLSEANLSEANLREVNFSRADLTNANLSGADLTGALLLETNLQGANLEGSRIYGISAWNVKIDETTKQLNLIITPHNEVTITVDNLEVAQFIYLLLKNEKIRHVIDTVAQKAVLILGRFTEEQLKILKAIREELRKYDYVPILFDFDKPTSRNIAQTVSTLAHLVRFVIADITNPKAVHLELALIIPHLPSVPIQILLHSSENIEGTMLDDFLKSYQSVLKEYYKYESPEHLLTFFKEKVINPAESKAKQLLEAK